MAGTGDKGKAVGVVKRQYVVSTSVRVMFMSFKHNNFTGKRHLDMPQTDRSGQGIQPGRHIGHPIYPICINI